MKWMSLSAAAAVVALGAAVSTVRADDSKTLKETARAVAKKTAKAIVPIRLVVSITIGDREPQEAKIEVTGTVIDESGLTVVPASALDPMSALGGAFRGGRGGRGGGGGGGGGGQMQIDSEITSMAIVSEDGKEIEADVVLKDAEIDLAFIKPRDASAKFEHVDLKGADRTPDMLDEVFVVGRLGRAANHAVSIATGQIRAVVKGAKGFYVCDNELSNGHAGCVAYAADGTPLGIFATRTARPEAGAQPGMGGGIRGGRGDSLIVIRPVSDILDLAKQANEKKVEKKVEKKTEEKKPEEKKPEGKKPEKKGDDF